MTDDDAWRVHIDPPAGGLARLERSIALRGRARLAWRAPLAWTSAAVAALLVAGIGRHVQEAPQRFRSVAAGGDGGLEGPVVERGIARELTSSRADVRIVQLTPAAAKPPQP